MEKAAEKESLFGFVYGVSGPGKALLLVLSTGMLFKYLK